MLSKEVLPHLRQRRGGSIVYISSIAGFHPLGVSLLRVHTFFVLYPYTSMYFNCALTNSIISAKYVCKNLCYGFECVARHLTQSGDSILLPLQPLASQVSKNQLYMYKLTHNLLLCSRWLSIFHVVYFIVSEFQVCPSTNPFKL